MGASFGALLGVILSPSLSSELRLHPLRFVSLPGELHAAPPASKRSASQKSDTPLPPPTPGPKRRQASEQRLQAAQAQLQRTIVESERLEVDLRLAHQNRTRLQNDHRLLETQLAQHRVQIESLSRQSRGNASRLRQRLGRMYHLFKQGGTQILRLAAHDTLARDMLYLRRLQDQDRLLVANQAETLKTLEDRQTYLGEGLNALADLQHQLSAEATQLQTQQKRLKQQRKRLEKDVHTYQEAHQAQLTRLRTQASTSSATPPPSTSAQRATPPQKAEPPRPEQAELWKGSPLTHKGVLPAPIRGIVRDDPPLAPNNQGEGRQERHQGGIAIEPLPQAGAVQAVLAGRVLHADALRQGQFLVILDHGKGLMSIYGALNALQIAPGDIVQSGQPLGQPAAAASPSEQRVYFELRLDGQPQNPLHWIHPNQLRTR